MPHNGRGEPAGHKIMRPSADFHPKIRRNLPSHRELVRSDSVNRFNLVQIENRFSIRKPFGANGWIACNIRRSPLIGRLIRDVILPVWPRYKTALGPRFSHYFIVFLSFHRRYACTATCILIVILSSVQLQLLQCNIITAVVWCRYDIELF